MNQLLLTFPAFRKTDPDTSADAAVRAQSFVVSHRNRIMAVLEAPSTIKELAQLCGLDHVAVARRMVELERLGLVVRTNGRRDGCQVWERKT